MDNLRQALIIEPQRTTFNMFQPALALVVIKLLLTICHGEILLKVSRENPLFREIGGPEQEGGPNSCVPTHITLGNPLTSKGPKKIERPQN